MIVNQRRSKMRTEMQSSITKYRSTATHCACPARTYHPKNACKHMIEVRHEQTEAQQEKSDWLASKAQKNIELLFNLAPEKDFVYPNNDRFQNQELRKQIIDLQDQVTFLTEQLKEYKAEKEEHGRLELLSLYN